MREFAIIKEIKENPNTKENEIFVLPMIIGACQTCKTGCRKQGKSFKVLNKNNLPVKVGSTVRIGLTKPIMALHGLLSFLIPIACSILGFFLSEKIALSFFNIDFCSVHIEEIRAIGCISFMILSALIIFIISRSSLHFSTPEITQII